jgi:hypothetical protein
LTVVLRLRRDEVALSHLVLVVIIALVLVGVGVYAYWTMRDPDRLDGNSPGRSTIAIITATTTIGDFDNQAGQVEARDAHTVVRVLDYDDEEAREPSLSAASAWWWGWWTNEFDLTLTIRCTGPHDFSAEARDVKHIQVDEWDIGHRRVEFQTLRFFVSHPGTYTLNVELVIDADDEGVDNETVYTTTKTVEVSN